MSNKVMKDDTGKRIADALELLSLTNGTASNTAGLHNSMFRGKDLGTSFTDDQSTAIKSGTFDDIFVGDYWALNGTAYRVAGCDIFLHTGDTELTTHHIVVVPDKQLYAANMNDTNVTTGAYYGSKMKTTNLATALTTIQNAFGSAHVLKRRVLLANAVSGDNPSNWAWYDSYIDLMTERQVYGSPAWGQAQHNGYDAGTDYSRLPLFTLAPEFICCCQNYWLRDVGSSTGFCLVGNNGNANNGSASYVIGVRPLSLIA